MRGSELKEKQQGWAKAAGAVLSSQQLGIPSLFSIEIMAGGSYLERSSFHKKHLLHCWSCVC